MAGNETAGVVEAPAASVLLDENGNPVSAVVELPPSGEPQPETPSEAVEIAQIEADASVAIAETHAAVEIAAIEARSEANAELAEIRDRNTWLESRVQEMERENQELRHLIPPPSPVEPEAETLETGPELSPEALAATTDTNGTPSETSSSTETEAPSESGDGNPVAEVIAAVTQEQPPRRVRFL